MACQRQREMVMLITQMVDLEDCSGILTVRISGVYGLDIGSHLSPRIVK